MFSLEIACSRVTYAWWPIVNIATRPRVDSLFRLINSEPICVDAYARAFREMSRTSQLAPSVAVNIAINTARSHAWDNLLDMVRIKMEFLVIISGVALACLI